MAGDGNARMARTGVRTSKLNGNKNEFPLQPAPGLQPWRPFDAGWDPSREGWRRRDGAVCGVRHREAGECKRRWRRRGYATGTAGAAGRMLLVLTLIAKPVPMSDVDAGTFLSLWLGHRHPHRRIAASVRRPGGRTRHRGMRHRAWTFDRGSDARQGQRHDQYPEHEDSSQRAHAQQSSIRRNDLFARYGTARYPTPGAGVRDDRRNRPRYWLAWLSCCRCCGVSKASACFCAFSMFSNISRWIFSAVAYALRAACSSNFPSR